MKSTRRWWPAESLGEHRVRVRVISATYADLRAMIRAGTFREDPGVSVTHFACDCARDPRVRKIVRFLIVIVVACGSAKPLPCPHECSPYWTPRRLGRIVVLVEDAGTVMLDRVALPAARRIERTITDGQHVLSANGRELRFAAARDCDLLVRVTPDAIEPRLRCDVSPAPMYSIPVVDGPGPCRDQLELGLLHLELAVGAARDQLDIIMVSCLADHATRLRALVEQPAACTQGVALLRNARSCVAYELDCRGCPPVP